MDRDLLAFGLPGYQALPNNPAILPGEEGEAMQATKPTFNGSAEHRIKEALETEIVKAKGWPWETIREAIATVGILIALAVLVWSLWR